MYFRLQIAIMLIIAGYTGIAQTQFAPEGAHWYNWADGGYYHSYTDGDTVISGITARKIHRKAIVGSGSWATSQSDIYVYNTSDTVFVYNIYFSRFTPLYIFNVNQGDTIHIPSFFDTTSSYPLFSYRVDSVKTILYDTSWLKTVFTSTLDTLSGAGGPLGASTYGVEFTFNHEDRGVYVERLGRTYGGTYPSLRRYGVIPEGCGCPGALWCYSDPTLSVKLTTHECDPPIKVQNLEINMFRVYPDPAADFVSITAPPGGTIVLSSVTGQVLRRIPNCTTTTAIDVSHFPAGLYLVVVTSPQQTRITKLQVFH